MRNKFDAATLRLTAWYLGVLMVIALIFSMALYQVSSRELSEGLRRQVGIIRRVEPEDATSPVDFVQMQDEAITRALGELRARLVLGNLIILIAGGIASYWVARRSLQPIERALEAQSRFTADASHELRTPLTAMRTEIEVALRDARLSIRDAKTLLGSNLEEIAKLEELSTSLLKLAHYDEGMPAAQLRKVKLQPLIEKELANQRSRAKAQQVNLQAELQPVVVEGDAASLRELIRILVDNAIKYSPDGGEVRVRCRKDGGSAVVEVRDHGLGIKASDVPHLFERFYRADSSRAKARIDGYGLGLSIAKRIAELHRGAIVIASTPGKGSVFTVKMPAVSRAPRQA